MSFFSMIAAIDIDNGIGLAGSMPWHFKGDLAYFKRLTLGVPTTPKQGKGSAVLMGRKTWESIPPRFRPLTHRINHIVTRSRTAYMTGSVGTTVWWDDLKPALDELVTYDNPFVIGGAQIYNEAIQDHRCKYLHLTRINHIYKCDTFFPPFKDRFELRYKIGTLEEGGIKYGFEEWVRT